MSGPRLVAGQLLPVLIYLLVNYHSDSTKSTYWIDAVVHQPNFELIHEIPWAFIIEEQFEQSFMKYKVLFFSFSNSNSQ